MWCEWIKNATIYSLFVPMLYCLAIVNIYNLHGTYSERQIVNLILKIYIIMESFLKEKVVDQKINGVPMENYLAQLCEQVENDKIEKVKSESIIAITKQMNNRHKNVIDAQRVMLKEQEFEINKLQQKVAE